MANKSDETLRQRIEKLEERGVDASLDQKTTVTEVLDLVGDLTLDEVSRLVDLARSDYNARIAASLNARCIEDD